MTSSARGCQAGQHVVVGVALLVPGALGLLIDGEAGIGEPASDLLHARVGMVGAGGRARPSSTPSPLGAGRGGSAPGPVATPRVGRTPWRPRTAPRRTRPGRGAPGGRTWRWGPAGTWWRRRPGRH